MRILFICKQRGPYKCGTFGLHNSAKFVVNALPPGVTADVVTVVDANSIDHEVTLFQPDVVILEAIWVTPTKLREVADLHPAVQWVVRIHSKATFLAQEGIAFEWMNEYTQIPRVRISTNNREFNDDLTALGYASVYLPNVYQRNASTTQTTAAANGTEGRSFRAFGSQPSTPGVINIGCFGAIRLLKNHLGQAIAAIKFADQLRRRLRFHVNNDSADTGVALNVMKNLRSLFAGSPNHELVEHPWLPHDEFVLLVATMNIGMQVSLSESFNIVTADYVHAGIPVVASKEVKHVHWLFKSHNDTDAVVRALHRAWWLRGTGLNRRLLAHGNSAAMAAWCEFLGSAA